jgi:hypothetical protein
MENVIKALIERSILSCRAAEPDGENDHQSLEAPDLNLAEEGYADIVMN